MDTEPQIDLPLPASSTAASAGGLDLLNSLAETHRTWRDYWTLVPSSAVLTVGVLVMGSVIDFLPVYARYSYFIVFLLLIAVDRFIRINFSRSWRRRWFHEDVGAMRANDPERFDQLRQTPAWPRDVADAVIESVKIGQSAHADGYILGFFTLEMALAARHGDHFIWVALFALLGILHVLQIRKHLTSEFVLYSTLNFIDEQRRREGKREKLGKGYVTGVGNFGLMAIHFILAAILFTLSPILVLIPAAVVLLIYGFILTQLSKVLEKDLVELNATVLRWLEEME